MSRCSVREVQRLIQMLGRIKPESQSFHFHQPTTSKTRKQKLFELLESNIIKMDRDFVYKGVSKNWVNILVLNRIEKSYIFLGLNRIEKSYIIFFRWIIIEILIKKFCSYICTSCLLPNLSKILSVFNNAKKKQLFKRYKYDK